MDAGDGGPYAKFNEAIAAATVDAYQGPLSRLGGGPDTVAKTIEKAATAERPRTHIRRRRRPGCSWASAHY